MVFSYDGNMLAAGRENGKVQTWQIGRSEPASDVTANELPEAVDWIAFVPVAGATKTLVYPDKAGTARVASQIN